MYQVNFLPWRQRRDRRRAYFWLGVLLLQVMALLLALFLVAGQLRHQQAQRQARLAMLGEAGGIDVVCPPAATRAGAASDAQCPRRTAGK